MPGGIVEAGESPLQACIREVAEEVGITLHIEQLLCVDYSHQSRGKPESLQFVFYGGVFPDQTRINLPNGELIAYYFVPFEQARTMLTARSARRIARCIDALNDGTTLYLENGEDAFPGSPKTNSV